MFSKSGHKYATLFIVSVSPENFVQHRSIRNLHRKPRNFAHHCKNGWSALSLPIFQGIAS